MDLDQSQDQVPFSSGGWVVDKNNPGQPGQYSDRLSEADCRL